MPLQGMGRDLGIPQSYQFEAEQEELGLGSLVQNFFNKKMR